MLHAAAGWTGGADAEEESQNSKQASHRDAVLVACTSSQQRKAGNAETEFCGCCVDLPCARRRTSKWPSHGGMVLRMARCGTKRQDGEEGRAEAVMRNVSKQCVSACRTAEAVMP